MAYLTFDAPRGAQGGMDAASELLRQRLGAVGQNAGMSNLFRRDPRAATALIAAQMQAQESAADRAQRGDIAGQELGYRRDVLSQQGNMADLERRSAMDRVLASLAGNERLSQGRMGHEQRLAEMAQKAAELEAARGRTFMGEQQTSQQRFHAGQTDKTLSQQERLSVQQMQNELLARVMDQQSRKELSQDDLRGRILGELAQGAVSTDAPGWAEIQRRIPQLLSQVGGAQGQMPPAPPPATAEGKFAAEFPELKTAWDKASAGKEAGLKKPLTDFLLSIPTEDVETHADALKRYLPLQYGSYVNLDAELDPSWAAPWSDRRKNIMQLRKMLGIK